MSKLTALQACQQTHDLWTQIAQEAEKGQHKEKDEIRGPWQNYLYNCPCCEFTKENRDLLVCAECPMKPEWSCFYKRSRGNYLCAKAGPYMEWSWGKPPQDNTLSCHDLAFFAYLIADMALEAIERIKKEAEITP
ncbi:MAG: hypothetical protein IMF11_17365 [Proteobacteria bacterium]|nr:hypothetical protein [Pseudomonadota bacterium]